MAEELEVKEITELNSVTFTDESLVLAYTEADGVGKATFAAAKSAIGAGIDIKQTTTGTASSAENVLTATIRNGGTTETKTFTIKNGTGLSSATQTESTDTNGLRKNTVSLKSSDTSLVADVGFTVKDGVGVKTHTQTESTDTNGLRKNSVAVAYTDGTSDSMEIKDGVGIKTAEQTTTSDDDEGENKFTITLTDGQSKVITVKNGKTGTGATVATSGMYGFHIDSGNLVLTYSGETAPSLALNSSGELVYSY